MTNENVNEDWRPLAERILIETDPRQVDELLGQLLDALDAAESKKKKRTAA